MSHLHFFIILGCCVFQFLILSCDCSTADEDLTLTDEQRLKLDKFKEAVVNKVPHAYMKEDAYLIRWLRARNYDPKQAEVFLMKNIKWRAMNKIDTILQEDWSDMQEEYPYTLDTYDKEGKPVLIAEFGHWDLRNADLTGRFERVIRYGEKMMEEQDTKIRQCWAKGKLVTRTILILDMDGFNLAQHVCAKCIPYILGFYEEFEEHYPGLLDKLFIINSTFTHAHSLIYLVNQWNFTSYKPIINTVFKSILNNKFSPEMRRIVRLYNMNKNEYSRALLEFIEPDQLPTKYGGTKQSE